MRAVGATKFGKPGAALVPFRGNPGQKDALITWLDEGNSRALIPVPYHIPRAAAKRRRQRIRQITPIELARIEADEDRPFIITRMLDLLREDLHPSAIYDRRAVDAPYDASCGVKFTYTDRSEPCYSLHIHESQNLR